MDICAFGEIDWKRGVYLGGMMRSNESVVGTDQGVIKAFAIKRISPKDRWGLYGSEEHARHADET